jgi:tRNA(His) 5'-end guanylyltransferase
MKTTKKDGLGDRMKRYENINRDYLIPNLPSMLRLDGKAFHTFTKGLKKPFDEDFMLAMDAAAINVIGNMQGAYLAYIQSDEITIYFDNLQSREAELWFDGNIQKIVSVSASYAANGFNRKRLEQKLLTKFADFDSRVFQLPNHEEVINNFIWRQQDATRNSILSVGQANFSQKQLHGLSTDKVQEKLFIEKDVNWNDFSSRYKRGRAVYKQQIEIKPIIFRNKWIVDNNIPIFSQNKEFIKQILNIQ